MKRYILACLSILMGATVAPFGHSGHAASPACKLYKVNASILDVRKDATKRGGYIDALENGDIACVTREQKIGSRMWGYVAHKVQEGGKTKPINGWVGLRFMALQANAATAAQPKKPQAVSSAAQAVTSAAKAPASAKIDTGLKFEQPVPFGVFPVRGQTLKELAKGTPLFSPLEGLDESFWKKKCTTCHKWNKKRLCDQGRSYIKSAKQVFRHQHPYGGPYKLALMRWSKSGCN